MDTRILKPTQEGIQLACEIISSGNVVAIPTETVYGLGADALDAEAVKVIAASPKWKPGRIKGEKVRTMITIPVEFRLEKKGSKGSFGIKK